MTLKISKINSTILSRIGVGAFLVAALAVTAPITFADDGPKAEAPKANTETKKVMKWTENVDGVETTKHIEITVIDGVTTAYSIDKDGNKTVIDDSKLEMMDDEDGLEGMRVFVMDGGPGEKHIKIMKDVQMDGMDGKHMKRMKIMNGEDGHSKIIIKRMSKGEDGAEIDIDSEVMFFSGEGKRAAAMVGAAQGLLDQVEKMNGGKELSSKARKKLAKARKALKEAQEALEAEE